MSILTGGDEPRRSEWHGFRNLSDAQGPGRDVRKVRRLQGPEGVCPRGHRWWIVVQRMGRPVRGGGACGEVHASPKPLWRYPGQGCDHQSSITTRDL
jgi:hypothetical protein